VIDVEVEADRTQSILWSLPACRGQNRLRRSNFDPFTQLGCVVHTNAA